MRCENCTNGNHTGTNGTPGCTGQPDGWQDSTSCDCSCGERVSTYASLPECEDCHGNYWQTVRREDYNGPTEFVRCGLCDRLWRVSVLLESA